MIIFAESDIESKYKERLARRSAAWFGGKDRDGFLHRSWMKNQVSLAYARKH